MMLFSSLLSLGLFALLLYLHIGWAFEATPHAGKHLTGAEALVGMEAVVVRAVGEDKDCRGLVRVQGETWAARQCDAEKRAYLEGEKVRIVRVDGLTLEVSSCAGIG